MGEVSQASGSKGLGCSTCLNDSDTDLYGRVVFRAAGERDVGRALVAIHVFEHDNRFEGGFDQLAVSIRPSGWHGSPHVTPETSLLKVIGSY